MGWLKGLTSDGLTADGRNAHAFRYAEGMLNRVGERRGAHSWSFVRFVDKTVVQRDG